MQWSLKQEDGGPLRAEAEAADLLPRLQEAGGKRLELGLEVAWRLQKANPAYLESRMELLQALKALWTSPGFREHYARQV